MPKDFWQFQSKCWVSDTFRKKFQIAWSGSLKLIWFLIPMKNEYNHSLEHLKLLSAQFPCHCWFEQKKNLSMTGLHSFFYIKIGEVLRLLILLIWRNLRLFYYKSVIWFSFDSLFWNKIIGPKDFKSLGNTYSMGILNICS